MKKVLIISYFFTPANFVGGERVDFWAKNLKKHGVYPIIVTRQWEEGQVDLSKKNISSEVVIDQFDDYEVHRLPMRKNFLDRAKDLAYFSLIKKTITLIDIILSNFSMHFGLGNILYKYSSRLIRSNESIVSIIASGRPFKSFHIGYKLKKQFPSIKWIPDYRDEWSTHQNPENSSFLWKIIRKIESKSELRWTSNCDYFISVSDNWIDSISKFIKKPGKEIRNGYNNYPKLRSKRPESNVFHLAYLGSLYNSQKIELVLNSIREIQKVKSIQVTFLGIESNSGQVDRIRKITKGIKNVEIKKRLQKKELEKQLLKFDLLFLTGFKNVKGWYPVKLFHYFETGIPFLLAPSDNDVMERFCKETNSGYIANSIDECKKILLELATKKEKGQMPLKKINKTTSINYSREYQTKLLANFINEL